MKKKDIVYLVLAVIILLAAGYIAYAKLLTHGANTGVQVDVVGTIQSSFSQDNLDTLADPTKVLDFYQPIDLTTGLNNTAPFGQ